MLTWRVVCVPWPPLRKLQLLWGFHWSLRSVFSGSPWALLIDMSLVLFGALPFHKRFLGSLLIWGDNL